MRARVRAPSMAWRASFPRSRLPASIEFSIKLVCVINSTIDNFSTSTFQPNDIIFHKVIDTKSNNVLGYKNSDASNNFNYVLSNNNSGQINFFTLSILDQDLNLIDDIDDYFLHLQFIKMKKQSMEFLLTKLVEYVKDIFLMIVIYI